MSNNLCPLLKKKLFIELKNKIKNKKVEYEWLHIINNCDYCIYAFDFNSHQALCCFNYNKGNYYYLCEFKNKVEHQTGIF